jgi:hypothetical protein
MKIPDLKKFLEEYALPKMEKAKKETASKGKKDKASKKSKKAHDEEDL